MIQSINPYLLIAIFVIQIRYFGSQGGGHQDGQDAESSTPSNLINIEDDNDLKESLRGSIVTASAQSMVAIDKGIRKSAPYNKQQILGQS